MTTAKRGWTKVMAEEGPDFIAWIGENDVLREKITLQARVISQLLLAEIDTEIEARKFWKGVPRALNHKCPDTMHKDRGIVCAYLWLHFLERYARTWTALEHLVKECRLPMGQYGVRTLDVGSGLGPGAFAVHNFYEAMVEFAEETLHPKWHQPPELTCVEKGTGFSAMRSHLWELAHSVSDGGWPTRSSRWNFLEDFDEIRPKQERADEFARLRWDDITYWDEIRGEVVSDLLYTDQEASEQSQSMHRYRLFVFANFFTSKNLVDSKAEKLSELLADANPGSVLLIMGGEGGPYPSIYEKLRAIAIAAGFRIVVRDANASSKIASVADIISAESLKIFEHAQKLSPNDAPKIAELGDSFAQGAVFRANAIRAFRKHRNV